MDFPPAREERSWDSLEGVLEETVVLVHKVLLDPERGNCPHVVDGLHSCLPALFQLLLVLGGAAGQESDLEEAEGPEHGEAEDEDESQLPGGSEGYEDGC